MVRFLLEAEARGKSGMRRGLTVAAITLALAILPVAQAGGREASEGNGETALRTRFADGWRTETVV